jgi:hypothetical protein
MDGAFIPLLEKQKSPVLNPPGVSANVIWAVRIIEELHAISVDSE